MGKKEKLYTSVIMGINSSKKMRANENVLDLIYVVQRKERKIEMKNEDEKKE
jgi:hypothetical protein